MIRNKLIKLLLLFERPISGNSVFFLTISLLGTVAPVVAIASGEHRFQILLLTLLESLFFAYILSAITLAIGKRWLCGIFSGIYSIWAIVEILHRVLLHYALSYDSIMLAMGTNKKEVEGFLTTFVSPSIFFGAIIGFVTALSISFLVAKFSFGKFKIPGWLSMLILSGVISGCVLLPSRLAFLSIKEYNDFLIWESQGSDNLELINARKLNLASPIVKSLYFGKYVVMQRSLLERWRARQQKVKSFIAQSDVDNDLQLVLIIGESFIKSHSTLYGYHLPVNPILQRENESGNLKVFSDYITSANFTVASIRNLLNTNCLDGDAGVSKDWQDSAYLPLIFSRGGWKVNFFSNQYAPGDALGDLGGMIFDKLMTDSCYSAFNRFTKRYDLDFVNSIADSLTFIRQMRPHSLDIWHLKGQHFPPRGNFPVGDKKWVHFSIQDIPENQPWLDDEKRQIVADYANATYYNDSVIGEIISYYRDKNAILVYFSDHGEEMYDSAPFGNRNRQRPEDRGWIHRQFDIPFFVWVSDSVKNSDKVLVEKIQQASKRPGMLDALPHLLLNMGGLKSSPEYSSSHDILSENYKKRARVTDRGYAYDK